MRPRVVAAIFRKDIVDALRDSRILVSLLTPILLAVLYNVMFPAERVVEAKVAYAGPERSAIVETLKARAESGGAISLTLRHVASADEARALVRSEEVDAAFVLPDGVDDAIRAGRSPRIDLFAPRPSNSTVSFVTLSIEAAASALAAQRPPATVSVENVDAGSADQGVMTQMGPRRYFVLATVVMMIGMIAVLAVPIMLTEESEKKTLDALLLVGSYGEVIVAKALVGLAYIAVSVAVMLALTRLWPADLVTFAAGTTVLSAALIGLGLLLGGVFKTAQQAYTWSSLTLIPVVGPAFAVGLPVPDAIDLLFKALPTSQGMRIMANGLAGSPLFAELPLSFAVTAAWAAGAFGVLAWTLSRREA